VARTKWAEFVAETKLIKAQLRVEVPILIHLGVRRKPFVMGELWQNRLNYFASSALDITHYKKSWLL
jgi:hypothetical protein